MVKRKPLERFKVPEVAVNTWLKPGVNETKAN